MAGIQYNGGLTAALGVKNIEAAFKWYEDHLGFKKIYFLDKMGWGEMETFQKGINLGISQVEKVNPEGGATLTFGVKDIDAARKELESKSVKFDGPTRVIEGMVKLATFYDPDGNALMFYQDL